MGADHAGFELKEKVKEFLIKEGYEVVDCGAYQYDKDDDYPDFISKVAQAVSKDPDSRGIILGGSGQGEAIVANKFPNIRTTVFYGDPLEIVQVGREHNDANVLSLGARFLSENEALRAVEIWLNTVFNKEERHVRRVEKIKKIEQDL